MRACSDEMGGSYSDHSLSMPGALPSSLSQPMQVGEGAVPHRMLELINQRLAPCTYVLAEQATAVRDLTSQLRKSHHGASAESLTSRLLSPDLKGSGKSVSPPLDAAAGGHSHGSVSGGSADLARSRVGGRGGGVSVSGVPIVGSGADGADALDVTRLLHKVYQYRTDAEIEEGLCARLSTVEARDILPQVERLLPALTNLVLYSPTEMVYLTRELMRLCTSSLHFASRFMSVPPLSFAANSCRVAQKSRLLQRAHT